MGVGWPPRPLLVAHIASHTLAQGTVVTRGTVVTHYLVEVHRSEMRYAIVALPLLHTLPNIVFAASTRLNLRTTLFDLPLESSGAFANNPRYKDPTKSSSSVLISSVVLLAVIGTDP